MFVKRFVIVVYLHCCYSSEVNAGFSFKKFFQDSNLLLLSKRLQTARLLLENESVPIEKMC